MEGVNEYKEGNNGINLSNVTLINKSRSPRYNVEEASNGKYTSYGPLVSRNMKTIMSNEANNAAIKAENSLKRMSRWNKNSGARAAAEAKVRYWENHTPLGSPKWKRNKLQNSKNALAALTQKRGWLFGGKHRKTHKRKTHKHLPNKHNKTKRNRN